MNSFSTPATMNYRVFRRSAYLTANGRDNGKSFLVVGLAATPGDRASTTISEIIHFDVAPTVHTIHGREAAQAYANSLGRSVYYFLESLGASCEGWLYPETKQ